MRALLRWMMPAIATLGAGCLRTGYGPSRDASRDRSAIDLRASADLPPAARDLRSSDAPRESRLHDLLRVDLALGPDAGSKPDLACTSAASQLSSSSGYLYVWSERSFGQTFTAASSGALRELELNLQCMNGGEQKPIWVALLATAGGAPTGAPLAERALGQLVPGWKKYAVDFSSAGLKLAAGTRYALQVRSDGSAPPIHHGLGFGSTAGSGADSLWLRSATEPWKLAPTVVSALKSTDALYFRVVVCP